MRNWVIGVTLIAVASVSACNALLPERFAIKGPILSSLFGGGIDAPSDETVQSRFELAPGFDQSGLQAHQDIGQ